MRTWILGTARRLSGHKASVMQVRGCPEQGDSNLTVSLYGGWGPFLGLGLLPHRKISWGPHRSEKQKNPKT